LIFKWHKKRKQRPSESGNMILAIFGAVAIVGTLGAGTAIIVNGPVKIMANVNQTSQTESQLMVASKMIMLDVGNQTLGNDCDNDRITEPREWRDAAGAGPDGVAGSDGGGFLPNAIGASKRDAWGTQYGYCVWDHGALIDDAGCTSSGPQRRLKGLNSIDHPVVAIISAGRNGIFETGCLNFDTADTNSDGDINDANEALITPAGDDVVSIYSYAEAAQDNPGLWQLGLNADGESVAILDPTIDSVQFNTPSSPSGRTSFGGNLELLSTAGEIPGMNIPTDAALPTCDSMMDGEIRVNTGGAEPIAEICKDYGSGYAWEPLGTGGASLSATIANAIADPVFDASRGNCIKSETGPSELIASETSRAYSRVVTNGEFIFAVGTNENVYVYTFDGQNFTLKDTKFLGGYEAWTHDNILVGGENSSTNGLSHYKINENGTLTVIPNADDTGNAYALWGRGNYIFAANNTRTDVYYYDGIRLNKVGSGGVPGGVGLWGDDKYLYSFSGNIFASQFNKSNFKILDTQTSFNFNRDFSGDINFFYAVDQARVASYKFNGKDIIRLNSDPTPGSAYSVYSTGTHVFVNDSTKIRVYKVNLSGILRLVEIIDIAPGTDGKISSDGRFIYIPTNTGLHAYAGYTCTEAIVPSAREDYIAQITVEQPSDAGTTLGSVGWAQGSNGFTGTGLSMTVKSNASGGSLPSASILARRTGGGAETALYFNTRDHDDNFNQTLKITRDGGVKFNGSDNSDANIQIGGRELPWNTDYQMGLMTVTNDGMDQGGYFGFEGESDASNVILFTDELSIKKTNVTGQSLIEFVKFEASLATSFFGDLLIKGESVKTALRNNSYSAVAGNGGVIEFKRSRGYRGTEEAVADGDIVGNITMQASNGAGLFDGKAQIKAQVNGVVSAGDVPLDVSLSAPQASFNPAMTNCNYANNGPAVLKGQFDTSGDARSVFKYGEYIFVSDWNHDLKAYSFDGNQFRELDNIIHSGTSARVTVDKNGYIYSASSGGGLFVYTFDGSNFTLAGSSNAILNMFGVHTDDNYVYGAASSSGFGVYSFDGTTLSLLASSAVSGPQEIWTDENYIYVASGTRGLDAFTFDGTTLTLVGNINTPGAADDVWGDGTYIYVADSSGGLRAYTFDGTTFSLEGLFNGLGSEEDVWGDGHYIYTASQPNGTYVLEFDGSAFTEIAFIPATGTPNYIYGDGKYIYIAEKEAGILAYAGFECQSEIRLKESGDVGINKKDPEAKLHVGGRVLSTKGIRVSNDTDCNTPEDEGTMRYTGNPSDPIQVCTEVAGWVSSNLNKPADPILIDCDPLPFDFNNILNATASTEYTTNAFIVGGLPDGRSCYLTASSDAAGLTVNLNGADQAGTIVAVTNGDVLKIEVDSGTGDDCLNTTISLGSQTDQFTIGTGFGCYPNEFYPEEGNCVNNNSGALALVDVDSPVGFGYENIWTDGNIIYLVSQSSLVAYDFDGTTLTALASAPSNDEFLSAWGDGTYIYVADRFSGIAAYSFNGVSLELEGSFVAVDGAFDIHGDGAYIYVADSTHLRAFSFNGSTFTLEDSFATAGSERVRAINGYIFVQDGSTLRALTFNGTSFSSISTYAVPSGNINGIFEDNNYIYIAEEGNGVRALSFDGTTFTSEGTYNTAGNAWKGWSDGSHIYVADSTNGVVALSFDGTTFSLESTFSSPSNTFAVIGDGTYIYATDNDDGLYALSGFECLATD